MFLTWPFRYDIAQPGLSVSEDLSKLCETTTQSSEGSRDSEGGGGRSCGVSALKQFLSGVLYLCEFEVVVDLGIKNPVPSSSLLIYASSVSKGVREGAARTAE